MPVRSDDPLRRVTLNLYEEDCRWLEREYGQGWTVRIRQHIHTEVVLRAKQQFHRQPARTLGDLHDD